MLALGDAAQTTVDRRPFRQQDPSLAPDDRRQFLDQMPLGHARRAMLLDQRRQQVGKLGLIFMRQDRQLGQNAVFQGIEADRVITACRCGKSHILRHRKRYHRLLVHRFRFSGLHGLTVVVRVCRVAEPSD